MTPSKSKKRYSRLALPSMLILMGVLLVVTKRYPVSIVGPVEEGALVVFAGIVCCLKGGWGFIQTVLSIRRGEEPIQPSEPTRGNGPDFG